MRRRLVFALFKKAGSVRLSVTVSFISKCKAVSGRLSVRSVRQSGYFMSFIVLNDLESFLSPSPLRLLSVRHGTFVCPFILDILVAARQVQNSVQFRTNGTSYLVILIKQSLIVVGDEFSMFDISFKQALGFLARVSFRLSTHALFRFEFWLRNSYCVPGMRTSFCYNIQSLPGSLLHAKIYSEINC